MEVICENGSTRWRRLQGHRRESRFTLPMNPEAPTAHQQSVNLRMVKALEVQSLTTGSFVASILQKTNRQLTGHHRFGARIVTCPYVIRIGRARMEGKSVHVLMNIAVLKIHSFSATPCTKRQSMCQKASRLACGQDVRNVPGPSLEPWSAYNWLDQHHAMAWLFADWARCVVIAKDFPVLIVVVNVKHSNYSHDIRICYLVSTSHNFC